MYNLSELLTEDAQRDQLQKQIDAQAPATFLRSVKVKIISNCNLRCEMCRYWRIAKQQLSRETVFSLLDHAAALGSKKVHFSGGEVTLHKNHIDFIAHATSLGMRVNLTSNGIAMDKERAKAWIAAGLRAASFSLDGVNSRTHDKIRGVAGAFKKTCTAIQILKREIGRRKTKLKLRVNTVLSQQNFRQLPALTDLAGRLGAIDVIPMPIDGKRVVRPSVSEIEFFNRKVAPAALAVRKQYGMPINAERIYPFGRTKDEMTMASTGQYAYGYYETNRCYAPWLHAFVSHDGHVYACCMTRQRMESLGNVKEQNLTEIFQGEKYEQFRQQMLHERLAICGNCDQYLKENKTVESRLDDAKGLNGQLIQLSQ
jgi:radical SAM protein with 4Fe4S-binding SPASM domain